MRRTRFGEEIHNVPKYVISLVKERKLQFTDYVYVRQSKYHRDNHNHVREPENATLFDTKAEALFYMEAIQKAYLYYKARANETTVTTTTIY